MSSRRLSWAIGAPSELRSSTWVLWTNPKGDVYAAMRSLGGVVKASLHRDGNCHVGFTKDYAPTAGRRFGLDSRHWDTWRLPTDRAVMRVLRVIVPCSELRTIPATRTKDVQWLPSPSPGEVGVVSVLLAPPLAHLELPDDNHSAVNVGNLRTDLRSAWVLYARQSPDATLIERIAVERQRVRDMSTTIVTPTGSRAALWDSRTDHERHVLELAIDYTGG